uniref:Solute carrier family 6 member 18 n=1 Tax=Eptatretus burgeri TaxID=7764 RepID=A0A8C4NAI2_EPTBU
MCIGQRLRSSCIGVWSQIHPCLMGLGIANMLSSIFIAMYYNTIVAWILWYFFQSFQETLPWTFCPIWANGSGMEMECAQSSPVQYFWYRKTLNISPQLEDSGSLQWWLVLCLCTAWLIIYVCTSRSIETTGKAVYVTGPFPYIILFCFLVRGVTLEGATDGLVYLFTPDVEILKRPEVWMNAATQIFFSLSVGFGGMIAFSSYNPIKNDCEMDAVIVALINSATSIFASIPVFSVLGFKATISLHNCLDKNIKLLMNEFDVAEGTITRDSYTHWFSVYNATNPDRVNPLDLAECSLDTFLNQAASGTGLVFIIFTEAIVNMPLPQLWSVLFFIMLCMLGMSSMFGNVEGVLTPLLDLKVFPPSWPKELIQGLICLVFLLLSLVFTLASGNYWLTVFNDFAGSIPLLFVGFFEAIAVAHIFGYNRFSKDMKKMVGRTPNWYWKLTLCFIRPLHAGCYIRGLHCSTSIDSINI